MNYRVAGIQRFKDRYGVERCYHRKTKTAIKAVYGSAEFLIEVQAIEKKVRDNGEIPGSLGEAVKAYLVWDHFKSLADATQAGYRRYLKFLDPMRDMPMKGIDAPFLARLRDILSKERGQRQANYVLAVCHNVFEFSIERGWVKANPVRHVKRAKRPKGMKKANRPWTVEECRTVLERAPWQIRVPIALAMFAGLRKRDCLTLPKAAIADGVITLEGTSKTGEPMRIPVHPGLSLILDAAPEHGAATVAATSRGAIWTESGFNSVWDRFKDGLAKEGLIGPHLTVHGLRHTVGGMLAEADVGLDDIRRALGQRTTAMAIHYSERAKKDSALRRAVDSLDPLGERKVSNRLSNSAGSDDQMELTL